MSDDTRSNRDFAEPLEATQMLELTGYSKQDCDIAFAAEVLDADVVSTRQLSRALASWTLHGSTPLADHLRDAGLVSEQVTLELERRAACRLKQLDEGRGKSGGDGSQGGSVTEAVLERLDESGQVARLLGISGAITGIHRDELRQHTSRYRLIRKVGQGGLGTVWLARDTELQRYVALKEIKNVQTANQAALKRFRREAEITGRLEHPAIVPIYQLGEDAGSGQTFYVMRFLGKQTLQDAIIEYHERREEGDDDPMLLRNLLSAFVTVCQAIGHAHSRKVVHRDLKPENVAIDSFGQVIVIDWGLAKVLDDGVFNESLADIGFSEVADALHTLAGQVLGSPLYMAPEQAAGRIDEIDEATDIYGLGAILFSILTGNAPHEQTRESSQSTTARELITAIASAPTPSARTANADVDPALNAICAKAMARRRWARYPSTTALAEDVQRWMAGEPVSAYREHFSRRVGRWIGHHRRLSQLIGAAMIIALVTVTTLTIAARQNYLVAQQARFQELESDQREIEVQLLSAVRDLSADVRFVSVLPPIQGIIDARANTADAESEDVWRDRLETIYEGLMRANANYLSIAYLTVDGEQPHELVRVERHSNDEGYIRRVPKSRLATLESSPLLKALSAMEPGDVKLSLDQRLVSAHHSHGRRRIVAAVPVFDGRSGDLFGVVAIEAHVTRQIQGILTELDTRLGQIYITDAHGRVLVKSDPEFGVDVAADEIKVTEQMPQLSGFFVDNSRQRYLSDGKSFVALRVQLDPTDSSCSLVIVQRLAAFGMQPR